MRLSSMFFALLFAPLTLSAQPATGNTAPTATSGDQRTQTLQSFPDELRRQIEARTRSTCPVGFFVDRVAAGEVAWTGSSQPAHHGQGLEIAFLRPSARIVSADIVVHGYPATVHVIPATAQAPEEVTQAFHLAADGDQPLLQSSIWTQHIASIRWVELTRLDYADGTAWQSSAPRQCTAAPSLYRPVAAN